MIRGEHRSAMRKTFEPTRKEISGSRATKEEAARIATKQQVAGEAFQRTLKDYAEDRDVTPQDAFNDHLEEVLIDNPYWDGITDAEDREFFRRSVFPSLVDKYFNPDGTPKLGAMPGGWSNLYKGWAEGEARKNVSMLDTPYVIPSDKFDYNRIKDGVKDMRLTDWYFESQRIETGDLMSRMYELESDLAETYEDWRGKWRQLKDYREVVDRLNERMEKLREERQEEYIRERKRLGGYKTALLMHHGIRREKVQEKAGTTLSYGRPYA